MNGVLRSGVIVPGSEWIHRDPRAWWEPGTNDTRSRVHDRKTYSPEVIIGHWTGGHHREGPETARKVVSAMNGRRRDDGSDMSVSCHFVIGWDGLVWQLADLDVATVHVGDKVLLRKSIGVETCWCGYEAQARKLGITDVRVTPRKVAGHTLRVVRPSDALLTSWVRLCNLLADALGMPREVPVNTTAIPTLGQARARRGALEHLMLNNPNKRDAAGVLLDALRDSGWAQTPYR